MEFLTQGNVLLILFIFLSIIIVIKSIQVVSQSNEFVIERFGKYNRTLTAGINLIVPFLDRVTHKLSILERQLDEFDISVITRDNVEVNLETTNFYRVVDAARSVYRIADVDRALQTAAESIVRSAAGKLELDELQSSRSEMNAEILRNLQEAAEVWGIEITRTEITDVKVDKQTKEAQRQQLNAERERRALVAIAEGEKKKVELQAEAQLYEAQKQAEAVMVAADAEAYRLKIEAEATAEQTKLIAEAISNDGKPAVDYDVLKRQVDAIASLASSDNSKILVVPTDVTKTLGSISSLQEILKS
ncbi:MAG: paraslipin [Cellvibrionales bacterium]|nr:paraslipin [Cellvibrionales bacterium]|tara:strand:+ start:146 stop:1057 length:912 start_codon:yes stop_codon:yes gene_type:complete